MKTLAEIWTTFGGQSDKGTLHSYIDYYETLLAPYRRPGTRLLEIGTGGGECMVAWSHYLPSGDVTAMDLWVGWKFPGIKKIKADSCSRAVRDINFTGQSFDIIIDDASHILEEQVFTWYLYRGLVRPGGVYVIEDVQNQVGREVLNSLGLEVVDRRHVKDRSDDVLAIWRPGR